MTIKCIECNFHWNVSVKKNIHPKGYICPICMAKIKKRQVAKKIDYREMKNNYNNDIKKKVFI